MSLKDSLIKPIKHKPKNWLDEIKAKMSEEDFNWLLECVSNAEDFSGAYLSSKLTELGYPVSTTTINKLRQRIG